jgi:hypothetical protein
MMQPWKNYTGTWATTTSNTTSDAWYTYVYKDFRWTPQPYTPQYEERNIPLPEGDEMKGLFEVILCYGEVRKEPFVKILPPVIADSEEDAKIKSGAYGFIKPEWDADYLTVIVRKLGDVKIKSKPQEVKQVG